MGQKGRALNSLDSKATNFLVGPVLSSALMELRSVLTDLESY